MLTTTLCRNKPSVTRYVHVWVYIRMYLDLHVCVYVCTYSCTVCSEISAYVAVPCSYSVMYFDRNVAFEALYRWASVNEVHISPALNRSSVIRRFEGNDAIEIRDRITFDFYTGLPHMRLRTLLMIGQKMVHCIIVVYGYDLEAFTMWKQNFTYTFWRKLTKSK